MKSKRTGLLIATILTAALASCSSAPPTHYYVLQASAAADEATDGRQVQGASIGVRTFQVDPPYNDDRIAYRIGDSPEMSFYHYHRWAAPLSRMLPTVVSTALTGTANIRRIEPVIPGTSYDLFLNGRVIKAEEIDRPGEQSVVLHFDLRLTDLEGSEIWSGTVAAEGSTQTEEVSEIVGTMSSALSRAMQPIAEQLGHALDS